MECTVFPFSKLCVTSTSSNANVAYKKSDKCGFVGKEREKKGSYKYFQQPINLSWSSNNPVCTPFT